MSLSTGGAVNLVNTVENLTITGFLNYGITVNATAGTGRLTPVIRRNTIGTSSTACIGGIVVGYTQTVRVEDNVISACQDASATYGYGIYFSNVTGGQIKNNLLRSTDQGIVFTSSLNNVIDDNLITGTAATRAGIKFYFGSNQNIYSGNRLTGNAVAGITDIGTGNISGGGNCFNASNVCF